MRFPSITGLGKGVRMKQSRKLGKRWGEKKNREGVACDPTERSLANLPDCSSHLVDGAEGEQGRIVG